MKSDYRKHLYALILAGGGGTRLWPKSRNKTPKQFLKLFGNETLLQKTAKRFEKFIPWERMFVVTVSDHYKREILSQLPKFISDNIIVEPARRETGPAHGIGATYIKKVDPDAVIITEAADRLVSPLRAYLSTLDAASRLAYEERMLVAVGVEPRYPHTGLGYIKRGKKWMSLGDKKFYKADKFVEKPSLKTAKKYVTSGKYYWNAGQFVWRADSLLEAISKHESKIASLLSKIADGADIGEVYRSMPKISIDHAVAERASNLIVVPGEFNWTDIGDWKELWENLLKDHMGNVIVRADGKGGEVININTSDSLIHTNGKLIAVVDVDNTIVIETDDALLVASKSRAQNVKKIVEKLKKRKKVEYL